MFCNPKDKNSFWHTWPGILIIVILLLIIGFLIIVNMGWYLTANIYDSYDMNNGCPYNNSKCHGNEQLFCSMPNYRGKCFLVGLLTIFISFIIVYFIAIMVIFSKNFCGSILDTCKKANDIYELDQVTILNKKTDQ
jgi:hypothetical protein